MNDVKCGPFVNMTGGTVISTSNMIDSTTLHRGSS